MFSTQPSFRLRVAGLALSLSCALSPAIAQDAAQNPGAAAQPGAQSTAPVSAATPDAIGTIFSTSASVHGSVILAASGTSLLPGSTVDAGQSTALIQLRRGGALRACANTSLTFNVSADEQPVQALQLSMGTGALEADYSLPAAADSIITPDFRIVLAGPAKFHLALGVDGRGNTCIHSLAGNSGAIFVSELMGMGAYQVKSNESVIFPNGKIAGAHSDAQACGCPAENTRVELAAQHGASPQSTAANAGDTSPLNQPPAGETTSNTTAPAPNQPQVEVDAPFVFSANATPPPVALVHLRPQSHPLLITAIAEPAVLPPVKQSAPQNRGQNPNHPRHAGFFARIGGFFSGLFHRR